MTIFVSDDRANEKVVKQPCERVVHEKKKWDSPVATLEISKHVILAVKIQLAGPGSVRTRSPRHPRASVKRLAERGVVSLNDSER